MSTSGTYAFGSTTQLDDLIRDAYERIGKTGDLDPALDVQSAILSGNLELASWLGRGLNLWTVRQLMLGLQPDRITYNLPTYVSQVLQVIATTPRILPPLLGGSALGQTVVSGTPASVFALGNTAGCVIRGDVGLGTPQPLIQWTFPTPQSPTYVGFEAYTPSNIPVQYKLQIQAAWNSDPTTLYVPVYTTELETFNPGEIRWWVLPNPVLAPIWRIVLLGTTSSPQYLSVQQILLATPPANQTPSQLTPGNDIANDLVVQPQCRYDYLTLPSRQQPSTGTNATTFLYYVNQQTNPTLSLFPCPSTTSKPALLYTATCYAQDLVHLYQQAALPMRFYDALVAGIALRLATKFAPDRIQFLAPQAEQAYALAAATDSEKVPMNIGILGG